MALVHLTSTSNQSVGIPVDQILYIESSGTGTQVHLDTALPSSVFVKEDYKTASARYEKAAEDAG